MARLSKYERKFEEDEIRHMGILVGMISEPDISPSTKSKAEGTLRGMLRYRIKRKKTESAASIKSKTAIAKAKLAHELRPFEEMLAGLLPVPASDRQ